MYLARTVLRHVQASRSGLGVVGRPQFGGKFREVTKPEFLKNSQASIFQCCFRVE
jgi:hypothetical protein